MQIRSWKNSCTQNENRFYSISLGVASLQGGWVGLATALSPATAGHFKFLLHHFFVGLGLTLLRSPSTWAYVAVALRDSCVSGFQHACLGNPASMQPLTFGIGVHVFVTRTQKFPKIYSSITTCLTHAEQNKIIL